MYFVNYLAHLLQICNLIEFVISEHLQSIIKFTIYFSLWCKVKFLDLVVLISLRKMPYLVVK